MTEIVIDNTVHELSLAGADAALDISIDSTDLVVESEGNLAIDLVELTLDLSSDDVAVEIEEQSVEILTIAEQGPMGPAGPAGSGSGQPMQHIFEPITDDSAYRGDSVMGSLTSEPVWQIVKIVIQTDGTPLDLYPDGNNDSVFIWDDRENYSYV